MGSRGCANAVSVPGREYQLVVEGELSDDVGGLFEGMTLTRQRGKTLLVGPVVDQAELQGLLQRVTDLGLNLISATALDGEDV
jgi:hypothetical protein